MRSFTLIPALALLLQACAGTALPSPVAVVPTETRTPVTILISIDGFRSDYLRRGVTPVLSALVAGGITGIMHPSFPSKTFPNHWTIVTGLRPDRHGITANKIEDAARKDVFTMSSDDPWWWNGATPIWVDAEKAGVRTATMFWPGSNVRIGGTKASAWPYEISGGTRPRDWQQYNEAISDEQRVNGVIDWLRRPAAIRPHFLTMYFDEVDTAGHRFSPDDPRTNEAVAKVDKAIGTLRDGLVTLGQPANLVIVADHGMAQTSTKRVIALDRISTPGDYHIVETGPYASITPLPGKEEAVEAALLTPRDHMQCWRRADIPAHFHYGTNPRIPPIFCLAEVGWQILEKMPDNDKIEGNHGYDNMAPEMNALFLANGPAFRTGVTIAPFDNVDVYPLLRDLLELPKATNIDGSDTVFSSALVKRER